MRRAGHDEIPVDHRAVVTIPGCVDGLTTLSERLGRLSLADALAPGIALAAGGFPSSTEQANAFGRLASTYATNPAVREFYPGGQPVEVGNTVVRENLARTLTDLASGGRTAFYEGKPGEDIRRAVGDQITTDDLSRSQADWIDPISVDIAGLTAWTIPPNSQGYLGPATLAVFQMLEPPDDPENPMWWHLLIEAYRCLAWERDDIISDPDTVALPANLTLDRGRLERAAESVDTEKTGVWPSNMGQASGTAYLCVADSAGMAVSIIQSNYRGTGSPFGADRSGFLLQDRGLGFTLTQGHPNELGPGKRPLHTLSPTLWTEGTEPRWILGCRGGSVQPQLVAQVGARAILGGADLDESQNAPRWTVSDFGPGTTSNPSVEPRVPKSVAADLSRRGHQLTELESTQPGWGPVSIIELTGADRRAASDPRVDTTAALVF